MFLPNILLFVPMLLASGRVQIKTVVKFSRHFPNARNPIEIIGYRRKEVNLSGLRIEGFQDNALKNVSHISILDISNNFLTKIPDLLFASLTNLEHLNLSHNGISALRRPFVHLTNLKNLDVSNNRLTSLGRSNFFGLTTSCVILLKNNFIEVISSELFENKSCPINNLTDLKSREKLVAFETLPFGADIKICINDTKVMSVEYYFGGDKILANGCSKVSLGYKNQSLDLSSLGIAEFQKGWYKLGDSDINLIFLRFNHITRLTSEMFNDLPASISTLTLFSNKIQRLEKGIIVNENLEKINFVNNNIIEIEDDVFISNSNLTSLTFGFNKLTDTKFALTLPRSLQVLHLQSNEIAEIFPESFSKLNNLMSLSLSYNSITVIHRDSFRGLSNLRELSLRHNEVQIVEAGSFQDLIMLETLNLGENRILKLGFEIFDGLKSLKTLYLEGNYITSIKKDALEKLGSLCRLFLNGNQLEKLENGTLHSLLPREDCAVYLQKVPIEMIHGGVFARRDDSSFHCLFESNNA